MPKKFISFGLLALAGWWLWKNAKKNGPVVSAVTEKGRPMPLTKNVNPSTGTLSATLPPIFKNGIAQPITEKVAALDF